MRSKDGQFLFNLIGTSHQIVPSGNIPKDTAFQKQKRISELRTELLNCQEKLPALKIVFTLFAVSFTASIAFIAWQVASGLIESRGTEIAFFASMLSGTGIMLTLFSRSFGKSSLLELLSNQKRLKQELKWEEQK